jgi:hypothetical protein
MTPGHENRLPPRDAFEKKEASLVKKHILAPFVPASLAIIFALAISCNRLQTSSSQSTAPRDDPTLPKLIPVFVGLDESGQLIALPDPVYVHADIKGSKNDWWQEVHWIALDGDNLTITPQADCAGIMDTPECKGKHCKMPKPKKNTDAQPDSCKYDLTVTIGGVSVRTAKDPRIIIGK